jgi:hypothetical protein
MSGAEQKPTGLNNREYCDLKPIGDLYNARSSGRKGV